MCEGVTLQRAPHQAANVATRGVNLPAFVGALFETYQGAHPGLKVPSQAHVLAHVVAFGGVLVWPCCCPEARWLLPC